MSCDDILCLSSCRHCPTCYTPSCLVIRVRGAPHPSLHPPSPFLCAHCYQKEKSLSCLSLHYPTFILLPNSFSLRLFNSIICPMMFLTPTLWVTCLFLWFLSEVLLQTIPLCSVAAFQAPPGPLGPTRPSLHFYIFACPPLSCMALGTLLNRGATKTPGGSACARWPRTSPL